MKEGIGCLRIQGCYESVVGTYYFDWKTVVYKNNCGVLRYFWHLTVSICLDRSVLSKPKNPLKKQLNSCKQMNLGPKQLNQLLEQQFRLAESGEYQRGTLRQPLVNDLHINSVTRDAVIFSKSSERKYQVYIRCTLKIPSMPETELWFRATANWLHSWAEESDRKRKLRKLHIFEGKPSLWAKKKFDNCRPISKSINKQKTFKDKKFSLTENIKWLWKILNLIHSWLMNFLSWTEICYQYQVYFWCFVYGG